MRIALAQVNTAKAFGIGRRVPIVQRSVAG